MLDHLDSFVYTNGDLALMLKVEVAEKGKMIHFLNSREEEVHIWRGPLTNGPPKNFLES